MPKKILCCLLLMLLPFTGCWDATDVKDMVIPLIAGFDYSQGKYIMLLNYPVLGEAKEQSDVLRTEGRSFGESRIDRGNKTSRIVASGDLKGVIIGEELAKRGTEGLFDYLFRFTTLSQTVRLIVADGSAEDIFQVEPKQYRSVGENVLDLMRNSGQNNFIPDENLHRFKINVYTAGFNPVLPVIKIHQKDRIEVTGAALFKKYRMVAKVNENDMRALTWLRGEKKRGDIYLELKDGNGEAQQVTFHGGNNRKVKAKLVNGQPFFEVEIKLQGMVLENINGFPFAGEVSNVDLIERALEKQVQQQCEQFVQDLQQKYRVDAILLGKYARVYWPDLLKEEDWDEVFCNSEIKVKVEVIIQGTGELA